MRLAAIALAALLMCSSSAEAICMVPPPLCESLWTYEAVFEGTVTAIQQHGGNAAAPWQGMHGHYQVVTFEVHRSWRGPSEPQVELVLPGGPNLVYSEEWFRVAQGRRYLVFARRMVKGGPLTTSGCDPSAPIATFEANRTMEFLASLSRPGRGAKVSGTIEDRRVIAAGRRTSRGLRVVLEGPNDRRVTTAVRGSFSFTSLRPGVYQLYVRVPEWPAGRSQPMSINLPDLHACAHHNISLADK